MAGVADIIIWRATEADMPAIRDIFYRNEIAGEPPDSPDLPEPRLLAGHAHLLATGEIWIAEQDGLPIGFTARMVRGSIAYLADLFVLQAHQSGNVGRQLLTAGFPDDVAIRCTMSSTDPRAHALYTRLWMRPQWPNYWLRSAANRRDTLPETDIHLIEAEPDDAEWAAWDARYSGRQRPEEHAYWLNECHAIRFWFERAGQRIGYGQVQRVSDGSLWLPDAYTLGPIGAETEADAQDCVLSAADWTLRQGRVVRVAVPGPHPALKPLLDAHFEITYIETFHSSASVPFFDARLYLPPGDLF